MSGELSNGFYSEGAIQVRSQAGTAKPMPSVIIPYQVANAIVTIGEQEEVVYGGNTYKVTSCSITGTGSAGGIVQLLTNIDTNPTVLSTSGGANAFLIDSYGRFNMKFGIGNGVNPNFGIRMISADGSLESITPINIPQTVVMDIIMSGSTMNIKLNRDIQLIDNQYVEMTVDGGATWSALSTSDITGDGQEVILDIGQYSIGMIKFRRVAGGQAGDEYVVQYNIESPYEIRRGRIRDSRANEDGTYSITFYGIAPPHSTITVNSVNEETITGADTQADLYGMFSIDVTYTSPTGIVDTISATVSN